jgi:ESS family glutamate:Na+ symporter
VDIRAIEPLAILTGLIGALYYLTWIVVSGLAALLGDAGLAREIPVLWSFHFIIANLIALFTRHVVLRRFGSGWIDDRMLGNMTGTLAEYLVATSIIAISLTVAWRFALPIALICLAGSVLTYLFIRRAVRRIFRYHDFERFIAMFGQMTGTISSGLALLRVSDPGFRTPVAQELVLSSGMALAFGFPLLILINLPFTAFDGSMRGFLVVFALMAVYLCCLAAAWAFYLRRSDGEQSQ